MAERKGFVTMMGNPVTLTGNELKVGDKAPDATLVNNDMGEVRLSSFKGRVLILASVPSLDTPVCSTETRKFNQKASDLGEDVRIITVSMDLPFAQKRWCAAEGIERVLTLSDHRTAEFGGKYGVLIKELRLLARAVFAVDRDWTIRYIQIVPELSQEPDYIKALEYATSLTAAASR
jgi:thiol peroxidase